MPLDPTLGDPTPDRPADGSHLPVIHLNGSGRTNLTDALAQIEHRLRQTREAMCQGSPNMRDYYPTPDRWPIAQAEHSRRLQIVDRLIDDLQRDYAAIVDVT